MNTNTDLPTPQQNEFESVHLDRVIYRLHDDDENYSITNFDLVATGSHRFRIVYDHLTDRYDLYLFHQPTDSALKNSTCLGSFEVIRIADASFPDTIQKRCERLHPRNSFPMFTSNSSYQLHIAARSILQVLITKFCVGQFEIGPAIGMLSRIEARLIYHAFIELGRIITAVRRVESYGLLPSSQGGIMFRKVIEHTRDQSFKVQWANIETLDGTDIDVWTTVSQVFPSYLDLYRQLASDTTQAETSAILKAIKRTEV